MTIRRAEADDLPFLERMLYEAANWRGSGDVPVDRPPVDEYVRDWGRRDGDLGLVAEDENGAPVGAAWYRFFDASDPGFGFVDEKIPEITIAVVPGARGRGIGRALLDALIDEAARAGVPALSLSVEEDNPARRLYESCGFERVGQVDGAWTMRRDLADP